VPSDLHLVDRRLVSFGPTLSGVDATYGGGGDRSIRLISGGYFDEITEPYDALQVEEILPRDTFEIQQLAGTFRGQSVLVALWREPAIPVPCDARAIVALGLTPEEFRRVVDQAR
jgi:hypothetical protein